MTAVDALVVGAGVVGLTTAISLAEAGLVTQVVAAEPTSRTTSAAAGAIWGPVYCGPADRCREWSRVGLSVLTELADEPAAAVRQVSGREVTQEPASPPEWLSLLPGGVRLCAPAELPAGFVSGWSYTAPVVTMPRYLDYLLARYGAAGGTVSVGAVPSLSSLDAPIVVNCTGVGARDLVPDPLVVPVRGQVVVVRNPGIFEFYIDHTLHGTEYVYLFPHGDVVLLGGTREEGAWDLNARPAVASRILGDCSAVFPSLRGAEIVEHRVGLRPYRPTVRLEAEDLGRQRVLWHNYGHGGGGVTLSWGCAREITEAVLAGATSA
jgi:D-amino-acid oxidase